MAYSLIFLRVVLAIIFISHGLARLYFDSVSDFGHFLNEKGLISGVLIAWLITIGEIISGGLLAWGRYVRYCTVFHAMVVLGGIILVHLSNGWFVVGHGAGGIEYSILLLAVLLLLFQHSKKIQ